MGVVERHRRGQCALGHAEFAFDLLPRLPGSGDGDAGKVHRLDEMGIVEQQVDLAPGLIDRAAAHPAVVAILVDEALAVDVDEHPVGVAFGHGPGAGGEELLHMDRLAARAHAQQDAGAVVLVADRIIELEGVGAMLAAHRLVEDEAAGRQHHALGGAHEAGLVVDPHHHAADAPRVLDQGERACVGHDLHPLGPGAGFQHVDQWAPAAPAHVLDRMAARSGLGDVAERRGSLAARPDQGGIVSRLDVLAGQVIAAIGHPLRLEPVVMGQRLAPVALALGFVDARAAGGLEIGDEVLGRICKARRALGIGAAAPADVDLAARQARGPAAARIALEQHHLRARIGGFDRGAGPGRAEADHGHICLEVPAFDRIGRKGTMKRDLNHQPLAP